MYVSQVQELRYSNCFAPYAVVQAFNSRARSASRMLLTHARYSRRRASSQMKTLTSLTDLFSRRFREGISFPNFVDRFILKMSLSKICAVPFALQNRALFEGENRVKRCPEKGRKRGGQQRGQKGKKDA